MAKKLPTQFIRTICSSVFVFLSVCVFGQVTPTIGSFSPTSGQIGTIITIVGTNFNTTSASNVVFFGAVRATSVTATSSTTLTVIVPYGANYKYLSVTNLDYNTTGYSEVPFVVTTPSNWFMDFGSDPALAATSPYTLALGDLNGDGKPDLVVGGVVGGNSSIYVCLNGSVAFGPLSYSISQLLTTNSSLSFKRR